MENKLLPAVLAVLMLNACGLKGDLYLEEDPEATPAEQEQVEYLEDALQEDTVELEATPFEELEEDIAETP